jgi:hypothetical protein
VITNIGVVVSALVSVGALAVSFIAHRHQVDRARVLDTKEHRLELAERLLAERQARDDRRAELAQASMIDARVVWTPSSLVDGLLAAELKITNRSNQPVSALSAWVGASSIDDVSGGLAAASSRTFQIPLVLEALAPTDAERDFVNGAYSVAFTDAAGIHWHRDNSGGLRQGSRLDSGEWSWGRREGPPVVQAIDIGPGNTTAAGPGHGPAPARTLSACLLPVALMLLIIVIWVVFFR